MKKKASKKKSADLKTIDVFEFACRLRMLAKDQDTRFVFFLGAGCSVTSGIPAAGELARQWLRTFKDDIRGEKGIDLKEWVKSTTDYKGFTNENAADYYSQIIKDLFFSEDERQKEIERVVTGRDPGFGYAVLARLMGDNEFGRTFNKVLTTNFDDLVADALYVYSHKKPLVITHESLIGYAQVSSIKPTVIKLHGDAHFSPKNTEEELTQLEPKVKRAMAGILKESYLVFIGYGGSDEGILEILKEVGNLKDKVYWVNTTMPNNSFGDWLQGIDAKLVHHRDFDQLMLLVNKEFGLKHPNSSRFDSLIDAYHSTFEELEKRIQKESTGETKAQLEQVFEDVSEKFEDWYSVYIEAVKYRDNNPKRADAVYKKGLEKFPDSPDLLASYGWFLSVQKDYKNAEKYYKKAVSKSSNNSGVMFMYATFLHERVGELEEAEKYYLKALEIDPSDCSYMGNYGGLLILLGKKAKGEEFLLRAVDGSATDLGLRRTYLGFLFDSYVYLHEQVGRSNLRLVKELLVEGVRLGGSWLIGNVRQWAEKKGHVNLGFLDQLIKVMDDKADIGTLDKFKEWGEA